MLFIIYVYLFSLKKLFTVEMEWIGWLGIRSVVVAAAEGDNDEGLKGYCLYLGLPLKQLHRTSILVIVLAETKTKTRRPVTNGKYDFPI